MTAGRPRAPTPLESARALGQGILGGGRAPVTRAQLLDFLQLDVENPEAAMTAYLEGARDALLEARDWWRNVGSVDSAACVALQSNISMLLRATRTPHDPHSRHALALVNLMLEVTAHDDVGNAALASSLRELRQRCLRDLDDLLLGRRFCPDIARRINFGARYIPTTAKMAGYRFTHAEQVRVALDQSNLSDLTVARAISYAQTPTAMTAVLDFWPPDPNRDEARSEIGEFALKPVVTGATDADANGRQATALSLFRVLRDHPRSRAHFWADVLTSWDPGPQALEAFEALALETKGPEADAVLQQLADAQAENWKVPADIAGRAAMRLSMLRAPVIEMDAP